MEPQLIVTLVTDLGAFGFILWLVQRTFSHTIPRLATGFEESMTAAQAAFRESLEKQREDFREMARVQREDFERMLAREQQLQNAQMDRVIRAIEELGKEVRDVAS